MGRFLIGCMVIGFASLVAAGIAAVWSTGRNQEHIRAVNHTYEVELAIARANILIEQARIGTARLCHRAAAGISGELQDDRRADPRCPAPHRCADRRQSPGKGQSRPVAPAGRGDRAAPRHHQCAGRGGADRRGDQRLHRRDHRAPDARHPRSRQGDGRARSRHCSRCAMPSSGPACGPSM